MASVCFLPESCRNREWLDLFAPPPSVLVAAPVNLAMMEPTDRDRKAVAHLSSHRARFCKFDVVSIGRTPTANKTRLGRDKSQMIAVALSDWLTDNGDGLGPRVASWRALSVPIRFAGIIAGCRFSEASKPHGESAFQSLGIGAGELVLEGKDPLPSWQGPQNRQADRALRSVGPADARTRHLWRVAI